MVETKDSRFSIGWMVAGTIIMFMLSYLGGIVVVAAKLKGDWLVFGVAEICFFLGGVIVGKKSPGRTILEAGLAALIALVVSTLIAHVKLGTDPLYYVLNYGVPFVTAMFGGWLGEKWQGDA